MSKPKWAGQKSTRHISDKQEKIVAKMLNGRKTINSGATLGQNDVETKAFDIEAKITAAKSFIIKESDLTKLRKKTKIGKIPLFLVEFSETGKKYITLDWEDFKTLTEL